jgi:magnesium chelatase family protein
LDRIDIHLEVPAVDLDRLRTAGEGESSETIRGKVVRAREIQGQRFKNKVGMVNARMGPRLLRQFCLLDAQCEALLRAAVQELGLSARAHDKVLRVSRTIADLEGAETIRAEHLAEAIQYRRLDRSG